MRGKLLMQKLAEADGIEESLIGALTQIIQFHIDHGFAFGGSYEVRAEVKSIVQKIHDDELKHKRILDDTRAMIGGSDDDF